MKKSYPCKHCGGNHKNVQRVIYCKKNPKRAELVARNRISSVKGGYAAAKNEEVQLQRKNFMIFINTHPAFAEKMRAIRSANAKKYIAGKYIKKGHVFSAEHTAKLHADLAAWRASKQAEFLERQLARSNVLVPIIPSSQDHPFFRPKIAEKTDDYWVEVDSDDTFGNF